ncbi:MAG: hypothetical protein HQK84_03075 [Nitrospinae bacterium]|nr:hypothetical protein [Nitrospinota bacterium]
MQSFICGKKRCLFLKGCGDNDHIRQLYFIAAPDVQHRGQEGKAMEG